jgi:hypothetical protein
MKETRIDGWKVGRTDRHKQENGKRKKRRREGEQTTNKERHKDK